MSAVAQLPILKAGFYVRIGQHRRLKAQGCASLYSRRPPCSLKPCRAVRFGRLRGRSATPIELRASDVQQLQRGSETVNTRLSISLLRPSAVFRHHVFAPAVAMAASDKAPAGHRFKWRQARPAAGQRARTLGSGERVHAHACHAKAKGRQTKAIAAARTRFMTIDNRCKTRIVTLSPARGARDTIVSNGRRKYRAGRPINAFRLPAIRVMACSRRQPCLQARRRPARGKVKRR
jgi:hypothetical protein